jgi:hypothetical protein
MPEKRPYDEREEWTVYGIPVTITNQLAPGDVLALSLVYEPTDEHPDRYRITAVKVTGVGDDVR